MDTQSPVFIVASVRSGSTMLKLMLDHHPEINNPGECDFMFDLVTDGGIFPTTADYKKALEIDRIYQAKGLELDISLSYLALMNSFVEQFVGHQKILTMNVHRNFHRIPFVFPHARYIHLNRDPRDVARSCVSLGWAGHVYYGVDIWLQAQRSWQHLQEKLEPAQYLEVRYEDLLDDVETGLTRICNFLGCSYSEKMLTYPQTSSYDLPDNRLCYQWKSKLSQQELELVEGKIGAEIRNNGYELSENEPRVPGLLGRLALKSWSGARRAKYRVNKYGARLYLLTLIANRTGISTLKKSCQLQVNKIDKLNLK